MDKRLADIVLLQGGKVDFSVYSDVVTRLSDKEFKNVMKVIDVIKTRISQAHSQKQQSDK